MNLVESFAAVAVLTLTAFAAGCTGESSGTAPLPSPEPTPAPEPAPAPVPVKTEASLRADDVGHAFEATKPAPAAKKVYDAAKDFSSAANPTGAWSYGWAASRTAAFNAFGTMITDDLGLNVWQEASSSCVYFNPTSEVQHPAGTITIAPKQLAMHPSQTGANAVLRWRAVEPGSYHVDVTFTGISGWNGAPSTTTDVAVLRNGVEIFSAGINTSNGGNTASFSKTISGISAGETIDFTVGFGNGNYSYDSTAIDAKLVME